jgi:chemotaxis family two-component system sensor kinase Cph1
VSTVSWYRFDEDWHGEVIAETTNGSNAPSSFLGLHFPASDIPEQARRLYLANPVRLIADVNYVPAALVPPTDCAGSPIDLSSAILRSVSPVHIEYLQNMGVRASMSISIIIAGQLWGLIACHHYRPRRIGYSRRSACVLLGDMLVWQIASRLAISDSEDRARLRVRMDALGTLLRSHGDLGTEVLDLFEADGLAAVMDGNVLRVGRTPVDDKAIALIARTLRSRTVDGIAAHRALAELAPAIGAFLDIASGALLITLSGDMSEYFVFFRGENVVGMNWGGDTRLPVTESAGALNPRASFELWVETVRGQLGAEEARLDEHRADAEGCDLGCERLSWAAASAAPSAKPARRAASSIQIP